MTTIKLETANMAVPVKPATLGVNGQAEMWFNQLYFFMLAQQRDIQVLCKELEKK